MHDIDYEYLGRDYYMFVVELLRREKDISAPYGEENKYRF